MFNRLLMVIVCTCCNFIYRLPTLQLSGRFLWSLVHLVWLSHDAYIKIEEVWNRKLPTAQHIRCWIASLNTPGWWSQVSHVQNCRQLILVFGGIYSLKNWMASRARKLFTSFAQAHVRVSFAQARNHVDNWNRNEWIYNEKGYTT